MDSRGFTLVELIVVIAIIATLTTIAALNWNRMSMKAAIEGQVKTVHADLMRVRLEALYEKRERRVAFAGTTFKIYSSEVATTVPRETKNFKYNFTTDSFVFNTSGMTSGLGGSVCVDSDNSDAYVDSLVISAGRISLGKKTAGEDCVSDKITKK